MSDRANMFGCEITVTLRVGWWPSGLRIRPPHDCTRVQVPIVARICITDEPQQGRNCAVWGLPMVIVTLEYGIQT